MSGQQIVELLNVELSGDEPLHRQLYQAIVQQINQQQLKAGDRLPASRNLAKQLSVSRNTVQRAYDQLLVEGYLQTKPGSGVYVTAEVPDDYCKVNTAKSYKTTPMLAETITHHAEPFAPGIPDLKNFPHQQWAKVTKKVLRERYQYLLNYTCYEGDLDLRKTLVDYLSYARRVHCTAEQIIITSGAQEAINLVMRSMLDAKKTIAIENPGYTGAYYALQSCAAKILPVPVLEDGLDIDWITQQKKKIELLYITPSHQYPLGTTLPINKRLALLHWAEKNNSYIVEDDYDSEYHYKAKPLPSLQGLDHHDRVIYMGTFSKVLFPALRLGFVVVPPKLLPAMQQMKRFGFGATPILNQMILNEFIKAGYLNRHIKSMRLLYAEKHRLIKQLCQQLLPERVKLFANDIGMHICLQLANKSEQEKAIVDLNAQGFYPARLDKYYYGRHKKYGLVIGFANTDLKQIKRGIAILQASLSI